MGQPRRICVVSGAHETCGWTRATGHGQGQLGNEGSREKGEKQSEGQSKEVVLDYGTVLSISGGN